MSAFGITGFGFFCLAVFALNLTPGPDTAYIVGRSVAQGRSAGLVSALGISLGACGHTLASAFGLSALLMTSATAFTVIKIAGSVYLVYLGLRMLWSTPAAPKAGSGNLQPAAAHPSAAPSLTRIFWQAVITNLLNPKVALFFLSFFPQFVTRDAPDKTLAFLLLGLVFIVMSTIWNSFTALVAGTLAHRARHSLQIRIWLERVVGTAFVAIGVKLAFTKNLT
ncbi:LysE family translocator [Herbaspirillum autotrophicum]|uniref:LysE family translocator n=1 Tax=Herbaspirillum autotrophicum TaxID=180195 RepID=UPI00067E2E08|nr:LysE family translocator [Herbaspirillum autotrophicum]